MKSSRLLAKHVDFSFTAVFILWVIFISVSSYGVIQISNISDLQKIGNDPGYPLDGEYELTQDIDASDTINWNGGAGFAPIGTNSAFFTGKFNGNGHVIQNLYINRLSEDNIGLFGNLSGEVWDLGVVNIYVSGHYYVGGLVGTNSGAISKCYSTGSVSGHSYVGGLVGRNEKVGTVTECYSTESVYGSDDVVYVNDVVGGLVGDNGGMVSQCYSTGSVSGYDIVGGLVGRNFCNNDFGTISECYSTGSVSGHGYVGGLVGLNYYETNYGTVLNSYWDMETSGQSSSDGGTGKTTAEMKQQATYVGWDFVNVWEIEENMSYPYLQSLGQTQTSPSPIEKEIWSLGELNKIGRDWDYPWDGHYRLMVDIDASETINWDEGKGFKPISPFTGAFDGNGHMIQNLYINRPSENSIGLFGNSWGEVRDLGMVNIYFYGPVSVGGLVGYNGGTVSQCYSTGSVSGSNTVGGLVGGNGGTVLQCYSTGSVFGTSDVGGLMGYNSGTVSECYFMGSVSGPSGVGGLVANNEGMVSQCYSTGSVSGDYYVGGLVASNEGTVSQCYSTGSVSGNTWVGGLVGRNYFTNTHGTVLDSYWDMETSGQSSSDGGTGKTTAEMKQQATYVGWDFVNVWEIEEDISYPYLQSLGQAQTSPPSPIEKEIWSLGELNKIGRDWEYPWDGHYRLMVDIDASETINWDGGKGFKPISPFTGIFDGNGHVIQNLHINRPSEGDIGLFGNLWGEVQNLGIENTNHSGRYTVGGLIGFNSGTVLGCYSTGSVFGEFMIGGLMGANIGTVSECYSIGSVSGDLFVGVLVGENFGTVSQCYSTGNVSGAICAGGLVGENRGPVTQCYSTGSVYGAIYVGGLVGENLDTVSQCYSAGSVSGDEDVGGLVGRNVGVVSDGYWDIETSGQSNSAGGEGKTTAQMKQQATFVNWDFENVWGIVENETYPYLKWQKIVMPDVVGLEQSSAESIIREAGLTIGNITEQCSDTVPAGNVISQNPSGGTQVGIGTAVDIVVSSGPCPEGEGIIEGEGVVEGTPEGIQEGAVEGEGVMEGEGTPEGSPEGEKPPHSADTNSDWKIDLSELLRVIQFFNFLGYHCALTGEVSEDGYIPGFDGDKSCTPHSSDYNPQDWSINLGELLRLIQLFNIGAYHACPGIGEDDYCPGL